MCTLCAMLAAHRQESRVSGIGSVDFVRVVAFVAVVSAYVWAALGVACQSAGLVALGAIVGAVGAVFILFSILCGE